MRFNQRLYLSIFSAPPLALPGLIALLSDPLVSDAHQHPAFPQLTRQYQALYWKNKAEWHRRFAGLSPRLAARHEENERICLYKAQRALTFDYGEQFPEATVAQVKNLVDKKLHFKTWTLRLNVQVLNEYVQVLN